MQVQYDELSNMVIEQFKDYGSAQIKTDIYKESLLAVLSAIETNKATKWLADTTHVKVISLENQNWTVAEFLPMIYKVGTITHTALMNSKDIFGLVAMKNMMRKSEKEANEKGMQVEIFNTYEKAVDWLLTNKLEAVG